MKVHQYLTNKPLNVPAAPKSKQDNCFGRGTLFEVKELQIESKHDVEDWQPDQEKKIIDAEMCQSIVPEPPEETFSALHEPEMEKVKTSVVDGEGGEENLTNRGIINRNYSRENEIIGDERSMNILLNKQDSNINYLAMQTKQMLRLTQYSILCKEEKELKSKISMLEIACRKLKIAIRGTSKKKSPPLDWSPLSKLQIQKQRQLADYIKKEKATYHKHKTKLLLLNNYLQKKNQQIAFMPTTTDDLQIQPSIIQHEHIKFVCEKTSKISEFGQYYMSLSKHRQVLKDRIAVMKDSILLTQKYTVEKIQRSIKENSILRQEIEIMNTEINKIQRQKRRVVKRRSETVERVKSLKLVRRREGDSQNSAHEKKDIFKNNSYYLRRPSKVLSRQQHLKKPKNDYSNDFESFSDKKFGKKESQIKEQEENKIQMKRMQEYIAGQYFQQRLSIKNEEVNL